MHLQTGKLKIRLLETTDLKELWTISFGPEADQTWRKFNGPYFNDPRLSWDEFLHWAEKVLVQQPTKGVLVYDDELIGLLDAHWEDGQLKRWLEFGIVIYKPKFWGQGLGAQACHLWIDYIFQLYPEIPRVGFTTWSGNPGMMRIGDKLGLQMEARIRQVRFLNGQYYDSIKYGVLRTEWQH